MALDIAETIAPLAAELNIPYIFKGSYRKANRSRLDSFYRYRRPRSSRCLEKIRNTLGIPVVTDIHSADEAMMASDFDVDVLQIPAFLCRRTDLLVAAAKTGRAVNIKKVSFYRRSQCSLPSISYVRPVPPISQSPSAAPPSAIRI